MRDTTKLTIIFVVVLSILFGILVYVVLEQNKTLKCDTGKAEVVGDYHVTAKYLAKDNVFNPECAVKDCNAFNEWAKKAFEGNKTRPTCAV